MKFLKKNKILTVGLIFCIVVSLFACFLGLFNNQNVLAFADTGTSNLAETDNLKFVMNSKGDGYVVSKANNNIVEAVIPETYNGLPVTEVATSGFSGCTKLESVIIPRYVTKIGANAFANCKSLQKLKGMAFVTDIGNNAFAMCTQVENLIIPPKVEKLGSNIIRNVSKDVYARNTEAKLMSLNASWNANSTATIIYGNDLLCSEIYDNDELIGFRIDEWQDLFSADEDFELICSYENEGTYYPILEIADSAFIFCEFNSLTLKYDNENIGTDYVIDVNSNAFYSVSAQYIDVEVNINLEEYTESVFAFSTISSITLPYSLDKITPYMFQECVNLSEIKSTNPFVEINHLSPNVTYVGNNAFENCPALTDLYITSSIEYIGGYAFSGWGNTQTIYIDVYVPAKAWDSDWNSDIADAKIEFKKILVLFAKDGGKGGSDSVEASFGQAMPEASKPNKDGFDFKGYYSEMNGDGTPYYDENMDSVTDWDRTEPTILYACWKANIDIPITFDSCGGEGGTSSLTVRLNEKMPSAEAPQRTGYTFQGYFQYPEGYGTMYYNAAMESEHEWDQDVETGTIYAHWVANTYTVILSDVVTIEATYGEPMPAVNMEIPALKGHTFIGYFEKENGQGTQYYSQDMYSVNNWDIARNNVRLYPYNKPDSIQITILFQQYTYPLVVAATYGQPMPELTNVGMYDTIRDGYTFLGIGVFANESEPYYNNELQSLRNCDFTEATTLYGFWEGNLYTITIDNTGGEGWMDSFTIRYGDYVLDLPEPTKVGYTFDHYYTEPNGQGTQIPNNPYSYFNLWEIIGDITIYANWTPNEYTITLDSQGADNYTTTSFKQVYREIPFTHGSLIPRRAGYDFQGYYTEKNGRGLGYYSPDMTGVYPWMIAEDTTLYAYWTPSKYTVVLNAMGGTNGTSYVEAVYTKDMPNAHAPTRDGYIFAGYYTKTGGEGTQYYTATMTSARTWDLTKTTVLYAHWVPVSSASSIVIDNEVQELTILSTECLAASNANEDK